MKVDKWYTETTYVDQHTGEIIEKEDIYKFIIIKTDKHVRINDEYNYKKGTKKRIGRIDYTKTCRRSEQQRLWEI